MRLLEQSLTLSLLPVADMWLLAVLNSPVIWAFLWRNTIHGKDEVLRLKTIYTENLPIPPASDQIRSIVERAVLQLIELTNQQQTSRKALLDRLRMEFGVEKPSQKLEDVATLDADTLAAEVQKVRGKKKPLSVAQVKAIKGEHTRNVRPLQALAAEARQLERRVAELVNAASRPRNAMPLYSGVVDPPHRRR